MKFLADLERLDAAATPGPWSYIGPNNGDTGNSIPRDGGFIDDHDMGRVAVLDLTAEDPADGYSPGWRHTFNGDLIVSLRNACPALVALVRAADRVAPSEAMVAAFDSGTVHVPISALAELRAALSALGGAK